MKYIKITLYWFLILASVLLFAFAGYAFGDTLLSNTDFIRPMDYFEYRFAAPFVGAVIGFMVGVVSLGHLRYFDKV